MTSIIVGAGISGLAAAYSLKKRGIDPLVFEEKDLPGGRTAGIRRDGFVLDHGAQFFMKCYDTTDSLESTCRVPVVEGVTSPRMGDLPMDLRHTGYPAADQHQLTLPLPPDHHNRPPQGVPHQRGCIGRIENTHTQGV